VILFTDGVTECFNPDGAVLGEARLLALAAMLANRTPAQMVEGVVAAVDAHAAGQQQSDDITCLALRYAP
jgi:serine phosphatase RsbU (regulator of sigma subunit)